MAKTRREFPPDEVLETAGWGLLGGAIFGTLKNFSKGMRSSPECLQATRVNPVLKAGEWGLWFGVYHTAGCGLAALRQEDPWNSILAAGLSSGLFDIRRGFRVASRSAIQSAAVWAVFEGAWWAVSTRLGIPSEAEETAAVIKAPEETTTVNKAPEERRGRQGSTDPRPPTFEFKWNWED